MKGAGKTEHTHIDLHRISRLPQNLNVFIMIYGKMRLFFTMTVCMQSRATGVRKLNETRRFVCKSDLKPLFWNGLKEMRIFEVNCIDNWYAVPALLAIVTWHCGQKTGV